MTAVKCVAWDLDNTLWDGVLLDDGEVAVRPGILARSHQLDATGVPHSIASENDHGTAMVKLRELGLTNMFPYRQIGWNARSSSIGRITTSLNLWLDAFAFFDDQAFELAEVAHVLETGRNRTMQITYAFAGLREVRRDGRHAVLAADVHAVVPPPDDVTLVAS